MNFLNVQVMELIVEKAFQDLFQELGMMVQDLKNGKEINIHRALDIIALIDRNVQTFTWGGTYLYYKQQICDEAHKQGII